MAKFSNSYDPERYGSQFEMIPEGIYLVAITSGAHADADKQGNPRWEMECQPVDQRYQSKFPLKLWLNEDGCINALYDAAGHDPRKADPNRDYLPSNFKEGKIWVEIHHKTRKEDGKIFANIKRLYPAFHKGVPQHDGMTVEELSGEPKRENRQPAPTDFKEAPSDGFGPEAGDIPF